MNQDKIKYSYLFAGFSTLISVSFLDNIRGPLLPVMTEELNIDYRMAGYFLTIGCFTAIAAVIFMGALLKRSNERLVTLAICLICATPGLMAPFTTGSISLLLLGLVMGSGVSLMGSICSILTIIGSPIRQRGRILSIQQVMYGIGSFLAPLMFSVMVKASLPWWTAIAAISGFNLVLFLIFIKFLPGEPKSDKEPELTGSGFKPGLILPISLFAICVGGEVISSMWMSTFFVRTAHFSTVQASQLNSTFFLIIAGSRLLTSLFVPSHWERNVILLSMVLSISCVLLAIFVNPILLPGAGFVGPFFPLFMAQISKIYPAEWKNMTVWIFASIQLVLGIIHLTVGSLTDLMGIRSAFILSPTLLGIAFILVVIFFRKHPLGTPSPLLR